MVRDIDQPTAVFRRARRETCPALVGDPVAKQVGRGKHSNGWNPNPLL